MESKLESIRFETIATIDTNKEGKATLKLYRENKPFFEKEYKTFRAARMMETKLIRKYHL